MRIGVLWHGFLALGGVGVLLGFGQGSDQPKLSYSRDVLPILSDKCFKCHGPDAGSRMADLRLDQREAATAKRGEAAAIVPGNPEASLLVQRINHREYPMPPTDSGKSLSAKEIETLTQWIKEGAVYERHWAFNPLSKSVAVPSIEGAWPRNDIDRFILARLIAERLGPSPEANRSCWLRRVTFDLIGLPPTEAEIDAFLWDQSPQAYERVVDRLLASPHFGERMATEWLDAARYGDSYGYQSDLLMPMWPYRDWVVRAFNANKPYDQFLTEQLAGDLLPEATRDQRLATAFNRLHRQSNEGGSIALEFLTEYAADRVDTFGTAVLGLTLSCARCHDHKFDPITQKEFYGLFAYFNSIQEYGLLLSTEIVPTPSLLLPTREQEIKYAELLEADDKAWATLERLQRPGPPAEIGPQPLIDLRARLSLDEPADRLVSADGKTQASSLGKLEPVEGVLGKAVRLDGENGIAVRGLPARERWEPFSWSFWVRDPQAKSPVVLLHRTGGTDVGFCGFDLMLEDGYLTARVFRHWPGNAIAVRTRDRIPKVDWTQIGWTWDGSGRADGLRLYVNGLEASTSVLVDRLWKKIHAYGDHGPGGGDWTFGVRFRDAGFKGGSLDEICFSDRVLSANEMRGLFEGLKAEGGPVYQGPAPNPDVEAARTEVQKTQRALTEFEEGIREISVMAETPDPIPAYLLARGAYDAARTEENRVERHVPAWLGPIPESEKNDRLALARWATSEDHPLTARVAVNRLWQMLFGRGLVETSENFGVQGSQPTHPELLDYLARRFVDSKWNVKAMLRSIVLSATYRQDSRRNDESIADPENKLLSRGPSGRLSAEMLRDSALAAAGLLVRKVGGEPENPYQPAGLWQENNTMSPPFVQSKGEGLYRRSLYTTWKRTTPAPNMLLFDANGRESCAVRRPSTNTPLQSLALLNDIQFVEAARVLAEALMKLNGADHVRLHSGFRRLAGRRPTESEIELLTKTLEEQRIHFRQNVSAAGKLLLVGEKPADPNLRPSELAAWTVTVQTILNSDAAVWKR